MRPPRDRVSSATLRVEGGANVRTSRAQEREAEGRDSLGSSGEHLKKLLSSSLRTSQPEVGIPGGWWELLPGPREGSRKKRKEVERGLWVESSLTPWRAQRVGVSLTLSLCEGPGAASSRERGGEAHAGQRMGSYRAADSVSPLSPSYSTASLPEGG